MRRIGPAFVAALVAVVSALVPTAQAGPRPALAWPDGCVDRVEGDTVVVVRDDGGEVEVPLGPEPGPVEGACYRGGRRARGLEAAARARAEALVERLETIGTERIFSLTSGGR